MSEYKLHRLGSPILRKISKEISKELVNSSETKQVIASMKEFMDKYSGAGIAAPQIGINRRIIMFGIEKNPRYPDAEPVPFTVLINPCYRPLTTEKEYGYEGCLSLGDLRGLVPRFSAIEYSGLDEAGEIIKREATGFHARVFQHEIDHLDGVLFIDRVNDMTSLGFTSELEERGVIPSKECV